MIIIGGEKKVTKAWTDAAGNQQHLFAQGGQVVCEGLDREGKFYRKEMPLAYCRHYVLNQMLVRERIKGRTDDFARRSFQDATRSIVAMLEVMAKAVAQGDAWDPRVMRDRRMAATQKFNYFRHRRTDPNEGDLRQYRHGFKNLGAWQEESVPDFTRQELEEFLALMGLDGAGG